MYRVVQAAGDEPEPGPLWHDRTHHEADHAGPPVQEEHCQLPSSPQVLWQLFLCLKCRYLSDQVLAWGNPKIKLQKCRSAFQTHSWGSFVQLLHFMAEINFFWGKASLVMLVVSLYRKTLDNCYRSGGKEFKGAKLHPSPAKFDINGYWSDVLKRQFTFTKA